MSIALVALVWALSGGVAALWLCLYEYTCTTKRALCLAALCGPTVWLFIASLVVVDRIDRIRRK